MGNSTANALGPPVRSYRDYLPNRNYNAISWENVTEAEIKRLVNKCNSTGPGPDGIPMSIIKSNIESFSHIIAHLCNLSLSSGRFPEVHKIGNIVPLYKSKEQDDVKNYRPVSVCMLNAISKILEKVAAERLF